MENRRHIHLKDDNDKYVSNNEYENAKLKQNKIIKY